MLKNYFKIAWRNIYRHKVYTLINITGLAFGICACLVIYLINSYDLSFDRFHPEGDRIYRIVGEVQSSNGEKMFLNSPFPDVAGFQNQIPGFEAASGYHQYGAKTTIPVTGQPYKKFNGSLDNGGIASIITGPSYFDIFKYQWLAGNAATLNDPFRVVLTESRAHQYFGSLPLNKMIGKTVIYDDSLNVTVSGIIKDWDKNSDFACTDFISISTAIHSFLKNRIPTEDWASLSPHQTQAFVKLSKGTYALQVNKAFEAYIKKNVRLTDQGAKLKMWLQPITDIHFTPDFHRGDDGDNQFRKAYLPTIYALMGAALFILLIAAINFINLSTAQSIRRAKETGIRKVLGSKRTSLIFQFLTETFVLTMMAVCISVLLVKPVLSLFSDYIPNGVTFTLNAGTIIFLISVLVITTLLAGFYPAIVLSAYLPVQSLKGVGAKTNKEKWYLRRSLIVFQFSISLIFIIVTLVIGKQIRYMRDSDKGFKTEAIVIIQKVWRDHSDKANTLAENIKHIAGVDKVVLEAFAPMGFPHMSGGIEYKGKDDIKFNASYQPGGDGYIPFYEMKLLAGRNLFPGDSLKEIVVNQTFSKSLGFIKPEQSLGKSITCLGGKVFSIVGVVADFHENSFHETMKPVVIVHLPEQEKGIAIKLASKGMQASEAKPILAEVEKQWKKAYPEENFECSFLNESIRWLYDQETKTAWLMNVVMIITIFISCMGLFGLAMFTSEQRTKEISIRKILGASVTNIMILLSKDFVVLVIISLIIASPVAWFFMNRWLEDFAYRIHINGWIFILAGFIVVLIALFTVSFQAVKAAIANPVTSLRSE
ncbi:MAG TPA: ABC transporter permease [Puia sp.]|jgi:putative ABC transport system permease protein|nr:ABC transporter permease [Puia sp.]